jgi:ATP-dependent exoDNAse (exonuclease V) beta subunit
MAVSCRSLSFWISYSKKKKKDNANIKEKRMKFDENQEAAYLADLNAVVSAGAGSGKTTVLAERYVRLVTERGFKVNEALTLTFTRKAASEMRERIFKRLSASPHPLAKDALAQFDQARISTLDSFCSALARGASHRYGVAGDFRVDDRELARIAEESAVEIIMRERKNPAICRLVSSRTFETVIKELFADIAVNVFSLVKQENGEFASTFQMQMNFIIKETEKCAEKINGLCENILFIGEDDSKKTKSETLAKAKEAARLKIPLPLTLDAAYVDALIDRADFFASSHSFQTPKSNVKDLKLVELREYAEDLKKWAKDLRILGKTLRFRDDILVLGGIFDKYKELFLDRKRQTGILSFHDTLEMAVDTLKNDMGLRSFYKRHIKAVMIDEFQDNNEAQKHLLYLISEKDGTGAAGAIPETKDLSPDKLFFVGDEKQSIYRFRGADVSVFRRLSSELQNAGIALATNYRSTPELVAFFNAIFPSVFGKALEQFEAEFSPVQSAPYKEASGGNPVEIYLQETKRGGDGEANVSKGAGEAVAAAERIIQGVAAGEFAFSDIAVLFKSTSRQNEYERIFREAG